MSRIRQSLEVGSNTCRPSLTGHSVPQNPSDLPRLTGGAFYCAVVIPTARVRFSSFPCQPAVLNSTATRTGRKGATIPSMGRRRNPTSGRARNVGPPRRRDDPVHGQSADDDQNGGRDRRADHARPAHVRHHEQWRRSRTASRQAREPPPRRSPKGEALIDATRYAPLLRAAADAGPKRREAVPIRRFLGQMPARRLSSASAPARRRIVAGLNADDFPMPRLMAFFCAYSPTQGPGAPRPPPRPFAG